MDTKITKKPHSLVIENKNHATISAVAEVVSATEKTLVCKLFDGAMQIDGANIKIEKLSPEENLLIVSGDFVNIKYVDTITPKNFFKRIFK